MGNGPSKQRRRNSNDHYDDLQYHTGRGNIPTRVATQQINRAPPRGQRTASRYPRVYRNQEGSGNAAYRNFRAEELRRGADLWEYPVTEVDQQQFDFNRRTTSARQMERPIHRNDRGRVVRHPPNDPGPFRGVVDQYGDIVGATAHPVDNPRAFRRAHLEPLDRQGRQDLHRYHDHVSREPTWPPR